MKKKEETTVELTPQEELQLLKKTLSSTRGRVTVLTKVNEDLKKENARLKAEIVQGNEEYDKWQSYICDIKKELSETHRLHGELIVKYNGLQDLVKWYRCLPWWKRIFNKI